MTIRPLVLDCILLGFPSLTTTVKIISIHPWWLQRHASHLPFFGTWGLHRCSFLWSLGNHRLARISCGSSIVVCQLRWRVIWWITLWISLTLCPSRQYLHLCQSRPLRSLYKYLQLWRATLGFSRCFFSHPCALAQNFLLWVRPSSSSFLISGSPNASFFLSSFIYTPPSLNFPQLLSTCLDPSAFTYTTDLSDTPSFAVPYPSNPLDLGPLCTHLSTPHLRCPSLSDLAIWKVPSYHYPTWEKVLGFMKNRKLPLMSLSILPREKYPRPWRSTWELRLGTKIFHEPLMTGYR